MEPEKPQNIHQALAAVMKEVGYVQKKKQSTGVSYAYASEKDFIEAIRPQFVEHGIVVYPAAVSDLRLGDYTTSKGSVMIRTVVVMTYRFIHAPSETWIDVMVTGEGSDIGDKSANKALTGAYKYALRQALMIETGNDPDAESSEGPPPPRKKPATTRKPTTKRKPAPPKNGGPPPPEGTRPGLSDAGKKQYWESLDETEKGVYRSLANLIPSLVANCDRYDNRFAAEAAVVKLFPTLKGKNWPGASTAEDGQTRVVIYRTTMAYAGLRDKNMPEKQALAEAFATAKNL